MQIQAMITKFTQKKSFKVFFNSFWTEIPIFRMVLGVCSALAVTNRVNNSIAMGVGVIFVTAFSSLIISFFRNVIPRQTRLIIFMVIIGTFTILVDLFLKVLFPVVSKQMGPYVALIITNCIVLGRIEAFAATNKPWFSFLDGIGSGLGFTLVLVSVGAVRELLGFGTILGIQVLHNWTNWVIMVMSPGAFILVGLLLWLFRTIQQPIKEK